MATKRKRTQIAVPVDTHGPRRGFWNTASLWLPAAVALVLVLCYGAVLDAAWQFDDHHYIQLNPGIRSLEALNKMALSSRRYALWLSNWACYRFSEFAGRHSPENPDVRIFRGWNIVCHGIDCLAVFGLVRRALRARAGFSGDMPRESPMPWVAALLFAAHPLAIESVTYVSGRTNSQGGMFYLLGLYFSAVMFDAFFACRSTALRAMEWLPAALATGLCGIAAVTTKESHVTFPFAVVLLYGTFYRSGTPFSASQKRALGIALTAALVMGIITVAAVPYLYQRPLQALSKVAGASPTRALATQFNAVPSMLLKTMVPVGLNFDPDYPTLQSFADRGAWLGALGLAALTAGAFYAVWKKKSVTGFAMLLALLSIAPTNSIIERGDVANERNFYLAAAGGAIALASLLDMIRITALRKSKVASVAASAVTVAVFAYLCVERNSDFRDEFSLWNATVRQSPAKLRPLLNAGLTALQVNQPDIAEKLFRQTIEIGEKKFPMLRPDETVEKHSLFVAYADLAAILFQRGEPNTTVEVLYKRGMTVTGSDPDVALSYGRFLLDTQQASAAAAMLRTTLAMHPGAHWLLVTLGRAEIEEGQYDAGRQHLNAALNTPGTHPLGIDVSLSAEDQHLVLYYLALADIVLGDGTQARQHFKQLSGDAPQLYLAALNVLKQRLDRMSDTALVVMADALKECPASAAANSLAALVQNELSRRKK